MKKEVKPLSWQVVGFDCNAQEIKYYDILKYREDEIKKMKKKYKTREEFAEALEREMRYRFWSKAEWELIVERTEDGRIWLYPWCGCHDEQQARIDVTDREDYDWKDFADKYIDTRYGNEEKIDVWDQLEYVWDNFVDCVWNYHHKWQRTKKVSV